MIDHPLNAFPPGIQPKGPALAVVELLEGQDRAVIQAQSWLPCLECQKRYQSADPDGGDRHDSALAQAHWTLLRGQTTHCSSPGGATRGKPAGEQREGSEQHRNVANVAGSLGLRLNRRLRIKRPNASKLQIRKRPEGTALELGIWTFLWCSGRSVFHSYLSVSRGSTFAARLAGNQQAQINAIRTHDATTMKDGGSNGLIPAS